MIMMYQLPSDMMTRMTSTALAIDVAALPQRLEAVRVVDHLDGLGGRRGDAELRRRHRRREPGTEAAGGSTPAAEAGCAAAGPAASSVEPAMQSDSANERIMGVS